MYDMSDLLCFFSVIAIFDVTLFWVDFNSSRFSYLNVIIILINYVHVCGNFPLLWHKIAYGNCGAVNTTATFSNNMTILLYWVYWYFFTQNFSSHKIYLSMLCIFSSVKWSNPGHFLKFFFVISMYPLLHIFDP